jgi:hypothetical protein
MTRIRLLFALLLLSLALATMPAALALGEPAPEEGPAVVVDEEAEPPAEDAWTFRFLVPTLLVMTGIALVGVVVAYRVRVQGRYRVSR